MSGQIEKGLVVDSSFRSRTDLVAELRGSGLIREVIEASSVRDGIDLLKTVPLNACFVGASLSEERAVNFVKTGITVSKQKDCAFLAVSNQNEARENALLKAGAHGALRKPFTPESFSEIVHRAVKEAHDRAQSRSQSANAQIQKELSRTSDKFLSEILANASYGISQTANMIVKGQLSLGKDGKPSLAAKDALRLVLEQTLPNTATSSTLGTFDHHFVSVLVAWFSDRVDTDPKTATETLRRRLLEFRNS